MSELNELQTAITRLCILARVFYGMCVLSVYHCYSNSIKSYDSWVTILILVLDVVQVVSIIQQFNDYTLTDSLSILFSAVFILSDLLFILQLYNHSTDKKIEIVKETVEKIKEERLDGDEIELVMTENYANSYNDSLRYRSRIKF